MSEDSVPPYRSEADIGARIYRLRVERRLTQKELAGSECSPAYISKIEHGHARPSLQMRRWFAQQLKVPVTDFLDEDGDASIYETSQRERLAESAFHQAHAEMLFSASDVAAAAKKLRALQKQLGVKLPKTLLWLSAYVSYIERDLDNARAQLGAYGSPASERSNPLELAAYHWLKGLIAGAENAYAQAVEEHLRAIASGALSYIAPDFAIGARASLTETLLEAREYTQAYETQEEALRLYAILGNPQRQAEEARRLAEEAAAARDFVRAYRLARWADTIYREARTMRMVFKMSVRQALMPAPAGRPDTREHALTLALTLAQRLDDERARDLASALLTLILLKREGGEMALQRARVGLLEGSVDAEPRPAIELAIVLLARAAMTLTEPGHAPPNELLERVVSALDEAAADTTTDLFLLLFAYDTASWLYEALDNDSRAFHMLKLATKLREKHGLQ